LHFVAQRLWDAAAEAGETLKATPNEEKSHHFFTTYGYYYSAFLLYGFAIENGLKALLVEQLAASNQPIFRKDGKLNKAINTHDLCELADAGAFRPLF
jgi:hypothetical protein